MILVTISVLSELIMALAVLYIVPLSEKTPHKINGIDLTISLMCVTFSSICFNMFFYFQNTGLQLVMLIVNYFKIVGAVAILYKKSSIKIICLTFVLQSICNICMAGVTFFVPMKQNSMTYESELSLLTIRVVFLFLIILFIRYSKKNYLNNILTILPNYIYILVMINLFLANGLVEAVNYDFPDIQLKELIIKILAVSLLLCVFATLISLLLSVVSKKYYSDINKTLEKQVKTQISYYEEREKTYAEIRRFKHDYTNHIKCIRSLLKAKRYDEISEYLGNITEMLPVNQLLYNTGNYVSDAILSDKQNSVKDENITINFDGTIPTMINETDLCIILGNAVDNAIEACLGFEGERTISVYGGFSHSYFILTISNPTSKIKNRNETFPPTSKPNKFEHGFGLINISSVVRKYDGYMKIDNEDNIFTLKLTFNSIISEFVKS